MIRASHPVGRSRPLVRVQVLLAVQLLLVPVMAEAAAAATEGATKVALPDTVRGLVFADVNENGIRDPGEAGIPGILVSNQVEVVRTDGEGRFALPVEPGQVIYVHKPADHDLPLSPANLPRFSYVHEPNGSPDLRYGGLAPTGSLPESLEFPLIPGERALQFTLAVYGDPQPRDRRELGFIRDDAIAQIAGSGADLAMVLGDVMYDDLSLLPDYLGLTGAMGMPVWHVVGNHDLDFDAGDNRHARDTFRSVFGANRYSFEHGHVLFMVLDNVDYQGLGENGRPRYRGYLGEEQLRWIGNVLAEVPQDRLVVLATHIPLWAWGGETENVNTADRDRLLELLGDRRALVLTGHLHMTYHHWLERPRGHPVQHLVTATLSGTWWSGPEDHRGIPVTMQRDGNPNGFHLISFDGAHYVERFQGLGLARDHQIRVEFPMGRTSVSALQGEDLVVNVFSGGERHRVDVRVGHGPWMEMENYTGPSPAFEALLERAPETFGANIRAIPTNHLWRIPMPEALQQPGVHRIQVRAVDAYGRSHTGGAVIEVTP
ncbi:MAG: Cna protein B-type domain containing protein [Gemmatimonadales bacterium]|nr:MAG: Cna protein B-type domain containing protein [Gemmatimonadales bacterium]